MPKCSLPPALVARIDWSTLKLEQGSFVNEKLKWRHTDMLFSALCDGKLTLLYLLIEHQSSNDPLMALRLSVYIHRALEDYIAKYPKLKHVPIIFPLVVSHAPGGWTAPLELRELFDFGDVDEATLRALAPYVPSLRYAVDDLAAQTEQDLANRALSEEGRLTLLALRKAKVKSYVQALKDWAGLLRALQHRPAGIAKTRTLITYILAVGDDLPEQVQDVLNNLIGKATGDAAMSTLERLLQEGWRKGEVSGVAKGVVQGRAEGVVVGVAKGRAEGEVTTLLRQLEAQFSPLPSHIRARVKAASQAELEVWTLRVLNATSLEQMFEG